MKLTGRRNCLRDYIRDLHTQILERFPEEEEEEEEDGENRDENEEEANVAGPAQAVFIAVTAAYAFFIVMFSSFFFIVPSFFAVMAGFLPFFVFYQNIHTVHPYTTLIKTLKKVRITSSPGRRAN